MNNQTKSTADGNKSNVLLFIKKKKKLLLTLCSVVLLLICCIWFLVGRSLSTKDETVYLYIDNDDSIDSVYAKIDKTIAPNSMTEFKLLSSLFSYKDNIFPGRYEVSAHASTFSVFRMLRGGKQTPVRIVIPSTWTKEMALGRIAERLMTDSLSLVRVFNKPSLCRKYNLDTRTVVSVLIPNSYDVYWNITPEEFLDKMFVESNKFWTDERLRKAKAMNLSTVEVLTLASIVDAETSNSKEKPMVAGLYINRLHKGMPLQSDPTVKYALGNFELHRVYNNMLRTKSPYNTYINVGLPPSPIRIPTVDGIDAVLNYTKHDYIYMCAKDDLSGTHNFAKSYGEHQTNAKKYVNAINKINVK